MALLKGLSNQEQPNQEESATETASSHEIPTVNDSLQKQLEDLDEELEIVEREISKAFNQMIVFENHKEKLLNERDFLKVSDLINSLLKKGKIQLDVLKSLEIIMIPHDPHCKRIDITTPVYPKVIALFQKILSESDDKDTKDFSTFQLALHELRCEKYDEAESLISSINNEPLKEEYVYRRLNRRY